VENTCALFRVFYFPVISARVLYGNLFFLQSAFSFVEHTDLSGMGVVVYYQTLKRLESTALKDSSHGFFILQDRSMQAG